MGRAVALLRAVNVGGRTASKAQLTAALEGAGLTGVSTFLASGNVLFDLPPAPPGGLPGLATPLRGGLAPGGGLPGGAPAPVTPLSGGSAPASSAASGSDPTGQPADDRSDAWCADERAALELRIEASLQTVFGFPVEVFVRTAAELAALAAYDAFPGVDAAVGRQVVFLKATPSEPAHAALTALSTDRDTLLVTDLEVWWLTRDGVGRSALRPGALDRAAGQPVTARSRTTVTRLAALLEP